MSVSAYTVYAQNAVEPTEEDFLASAEFSAFDFFVGGNYHGLAYVSLTADWIKFDNIDDILAFLPPSAHSDDVKDLLGGLIPEYREIEGVGEIEIDFNAFTITLELDQSLSPVTDVESLDVLPETETGLALRNTLLGTGSASIRDGFDSENLTLTHDSIASFGRTNIVSRGSLSSAAGYEITDAALSREGYAFGQELVGSVGLLETTGQRFSRSLDFYGFNLQTNEELFFRDEQNQATRVEIFLSNRSTVEVFRESQNNGRTLFSQVLNFGTVVLDTRSFPEGSYNIEIVITDDQGGVTSETRPFSKTNSLVPIGAPQIEVSAGVVRNDLNTTDQGVLFGSYRKRVTDRTEVGLSALVVEDDVLVEAGLRNEKPFNYFGFKGLVETLLTAGLNDQAELTGLEASRLWLGESSSVFLSASKTFDQGETAGALITDGEISPFLQAREAVNFNYSTGVNVFGRAARAGFNAEWSDTDTNEPTYRYGGQFTIPLIRKQHSTSELEMQYTVTQDDQQAIASITWRQNDKAFQRNHRITARDQGDESEIITTTGVLFDGSAGEYDDWRKDARGFVGLRLDPALSNTDDRVIIGDLDAEYTGRFARVSAFINNNFSESEGRYGGEFQNTLLWSKETGITAIGENISENNAYVAVRLSGPEGAEIGIAVDGAPREFGLSGEIVLVEIPTYKTIELSAFPKTIESHKIPDSKYSVTGYPGNILHRSFDVYKTIFLFGELVNAQGEPIVNTRFNQADNVYYTDEFGGFYIEYLLDGQSDSLVFDVEDGSCAMTLPEVEEGELILELGGITCNTL